MNFKFQIATKVIFGTHCIMENRDEFAKYGRKAFIVTGRNSGKASGALEDVISALKSAGIEFAIFDKIENNPSLENVSEGGRAAASYNADFIIGIGGGSPLDAAKAVAVLAVNKMDALELFNNSFEVEPLPVIAVPTTAGTGSEVTPYCILTRNDIQTKMSFGNEYTFPKVAFMDAKYTGTLSYEVTVNTAVDALSHAVEGYLSKRSTPMSDIFAVEAIGIFGACIRSLMNNDITTHVREKLLYMAMLGGMVIAHTGTTIVHGMGYSLTYFKDIPHGKANGLLMKEYLRFNYSHAREKTDKILQLLNISDIDDFGSIMGKLLKDRLDLKEDEMELYAVLAMKQRSTGFNIREVRKEDLVEIYRDSAGRDSMTVT